jgi:hypothetical protein
MSPSQLARVWWVFSVNYDGSWVSTVVKSSTVDGETRWRCSTLFLCNARPTRVRWITLLANER